MAFGDLVQSVATTTGVSGDLTSPTLGVGATAGNLLVVTAARSAPHSSGGAWPTVNGTAAIQDSGIAPGPNMGAAIWAVVAAGSETGVTFAGETNASGNWTVTLAEYERPTGGFASPALDVSAEDTSALASTVTTLSSGTTAATAVASSFAVALFAIDNGGNFGTPAFTNSFALSFTTISGARAGHLVATKVLSATGTQETTLSYSAGGAADELYGAIAVFSSSGGGGGGGKPWLYYARMRAH